MNKIIDAELISEKRQGNELFLQLKVPQDLSYLEGHFPEHPIVPGVVQIQWVIDHATRHFGFQPKMLNMKKVKFHEFWQSGQTADVEITWLPEKNRLNFSLRTKTAKLSSGVFIFN